MSMEFMILFIFFFLDFSESRNCTFKMRLSYCIYSGILVLQRKTQVV